MAKVSKELDDFAKSPKKNKVLPNTAATISFLCIVKDDRFTHTHVLTKQFYLGATVTIINTKESSQNNVPRNFIDPRNKFKRLRFTKKRLTSHHHSR